MIENELVFLVASMPDVTGAKSKEIAQHYLVDESNLRIRAAGGEYELTKKIKLSADDGTRKEEINIPLTEPEYRELLSLAKRGLTKTRYYLPIDDGLTAELNVYHGTLVGLLMAEVEFPSDEARASFVPPSWFGRDVSDEDWSSNSHLAGKTFAEVQRHLR